MHIDTFENQIKQHSVAFISLAIAITALIYGSWRDEESERNRTTRLAAFETLKNLGELQVIVNYSHFQPDNQMGNPFFGWGHIALISDMSELLSPTIQSKVKSLTNVWGSEWQNLKTETTSVDAVSAEIDSSRTAVVDLIRHLK